MRPACLGPLKYRVLSIDTNPLVYRIVIDTIPAIYTSVSPHGEISTACSFQLSIETMFQFCGSSLLSSLLFRRSRNRPAGRSNVIAPTPSKLPGGVPFDNSLDLSILGLGVAYPPHRAGPELLEEVAARHYPSSVA